MAILGRNLISNKLDLNKKIQNKNLSLESSDSDNEHLERGRNWRCRFLFNGLVQDYDLQPNCERPQSDEGRTFPSSRTQISSELLAAMANSERFSNLQDDIVEIFQDKSSESVVSFLYFFLFCIIFKINFLE